LAQKKCPLLSQTARDRRCAGAQSRNHRRQPDPRTPIPLPIGRRRSSRLVEGNPQRAERRSSACGRRIFLGPMTTAIEPTEILTEIRVPGLLATVRKRIPPQDGPAGLRLRDGRHCRMAETGQESDR
jgi:hypothetical protein